MGRALARRQPPRAVRRAPPRRSPRSAGSPSRSARRSPGLPHRRGREGRRLGHSDRHRAGRPRLDDQRRQRRHPDRHSGRRGSARTSSRSPARRPSTRSSPRSTELTGMDVPRRGSRGLGAQARHHLPDRQRHPAQHREPHHARRPATRRTSSRRRPPRPSTAGCCPARRTPSARRWPGSSATTWTIDWIWHPPLEFPFEGAAGRRDDGGARGRGPGRPRRPVHAVRRHRQQGLPPARHRGVRLLAAAAARRTWTSPRCSTASTSGCRSTH